MQIFLFCRWMENPKQFFNFCSQTLLLSFDLIIYVTTYIPKAASCPQHYVFFEIIRNCEPFPPHSELVSRFFRLRCMHHPSVPSPHSQLLLVSMSVFKLTVMIRSLMDCSWLQSLLCSLQVSWVFQFSNDSRIPFMLLDTGCHSYLFSVDPDAGRRIFLVSADPDTGHQNHLLLVETDAGSTPWSRTCIHWLRQGLFGFHRVVFGLYL